MTDHFRNIMLASLQEDVEQLVISKEDADKMVLKVESTEQEATSKDLVFSEGEAPVATLVVEPNEQESATGDPKPACEADTSKVPEPPAPAPVQQDPSYPLCEPDPEEQDEPDAIVCMDEVEYDTIIAECDKAQAEGKVLTYQERKDLPKGAFALKQKRNGKTILRFPIHDAAHARNALAQLPKAKDLSDAERATIKRKAESALAKFNKQQGSEEQPAAMQASEIEEFGAKVAELTHMLESKAQADAEAARVAEEAAGLRQALAKAQASAEALSAQLAATSREVLVLRRAQILGEPIPAERAEVIASMTEPQFALYLEARQRESVVTPPRKVLGTESLPIGGGIKVTL